MSKVHPMTNYQSMLKSIHGPTKPIFTHLIECGFTREKLCALYVVQVNPPHGKVKIGRANTPIMRWVDILSHWPELLPLRIIAIVKNAADLEMAVHEAFAENVSHGEWFNYVSRMEELCGLDEAGLSEWLART